MKLKDFREELNASCPVLVYYKQLKKQEIVYCSTSLLADIKQCEPYFNNLVLNYQLERFTNGARKSITIEIFKPQRKRG